MADDFIPFNQSTPVHQNKCQLGNRHQERYQNGNQHHPRYQNNYQNGNQQHMPYENNWQNQQQGRHQNSWRKRNNQVRENTLWNKSHQRGAKRQQWSNNSLQHSNSFESNGNTSRVNGKYRPDISLYVHPSMLEDPWEKLSEMIKSNEK